MRGASSSRSPPTRSSARSSAVVADGAGRPVPATRVDLPATPAVSIVDAGIELLPDRAAA
jgi:hypothetical protein